jgi:hypothetical protein
MPFTIGKANARDHEYADMIAPVLGEPVLHNTGKKMSERLCRPLKVCRSNKA